MKEKPTGLHCLACGKRKLKTINTRPTHCGIRRRKECNLCGTRVTTIEIMQQERKAR